MHSRGGGADRVLLGSWARVTRSEKETLAGIRLSHQALKSGRSHSRAGDGSMTEKRNEETRTRYRESTG